jgi:hypothetical protein
VLDGAVLVGDQVVRPGQLAYLGRGRDELELSATGHGCCCWAANRSPNRS